MILTDKVYIICFNPQEIVGSYKINSDTPLKIARFFLGKRVKMYMLCRKNHPSIILESFVLSRMTKEVSEWLGE